MKILLIVLIKHFSIFTKDIGKARGAKFHYFLEKIGDII
jgi:hypothetical protein